MSNIQKAAQLKAKGNQAFKAQNWKQAVCFFSQAIECNPNDHVLYSNRSGSYCNSGDYQKALEDAEKCIQLNQGFARGHQRKGTALFFLNNLDEAINSYKQGLQVDPNNASLKNDLKAAQDKKAQESGPGFGMPNFGGNQNPQFNQHYMQALIKLMQNPETKDLIADPTFMQKVQLIMQNPAAAQTIIQQDPRFKKVMEVLSADVPQNFDFEEMMKNMGGQGNEEPKFEEPPAPKKEAPKPKQQPKKQPQSPDVELKNKGNDAYKHKKFEEALSLYEQAIQINPDEPLYYNNKAAVYIELKQFESALAEVAKAEQLFADGKVKDFVKKAKILARKASILAYQGKLEQSIGIYEQSLIEDQNQKVKDELLKVRKQKKQRDDKAYINPELAEKHCEAGNALFKEGKFPQALAEYQEAIRRNPEVAKYYSNEGTVYIKLMEFPRARDCFEKALAKDSKYIKAIAKKGDCHFYLKEYHKALETYESGLKIDPENELCKQGVQKTQMAIFTSNTQEDQQTRAKRAMQDPQIQQILQTPEVRNALADLQNDPKAINNILKNPDLAKKFEKLIQAGILRTG